MSIAAIGGGAGASISHDDKSKIPKKNYDGIYIGIIWFFFILIISIISLMG